MRVASSQLSVVAAVLVGLGLAASAQVQPATPKSPGVQLYLAALAAGPVSPGAGQLLGLVTDAAGHPLPGAVVEVRGSGLHQTPVRQLTSADGLFQLQGLAPGTYFVQVGMGVRVAPRQKVEVHASERALLLVNLPQLLRQVQFGAPAGTDPDQAFAWALRQASVWKPVLRLDDPGTLPADASLSGPAPITGYVALTAGGGADAFSSPQLSTTFRVDTELAGLALASFTGNVGTDDPTPGLPSGADTQVAASFRSIDASNPNRLRVAVSQTALPGLSNLPALRMVSANYASALDFGDWMHLQFGTMLNAVSLTDTVATVDPYVRAIVPVSAESQLEFRAASAVPPLSFQQDFAEMQDPIPQVTLQGNRARLEHAHHQEVRYVNNVSADNTVSVALFNDQYSGAAINGAYGLNGLSVPLIPADLGNGDLLPNLLNDMFVANGGDYGGWGYRVVLDHRLGASWHATLGYAEGAVLTPADSDWSGALASSLGRARARAVTVKLSGTTPLTHTALICSYRALSRPAVTGLDLYDDSADQSGSFANISLRQPLPSVFGSGNGRLAALIEIHNLLAQGYIPMMSSDGRTLYLVQTARALRGGLTINF